LSDNAACRDIVGIGAALAALSPTIHELFDVATISRISLGRTWKTLDEGEQRAFIELPHQGTASIGILLTVAVTLLLVLTIFVLPVLLSLVSRSSRKPAQA